MKNFKTLLLIAIIALIYSCNSTTEQEPKVYDWRGEGRLGIYPDTELLKVWPEEGPELLWENNEIGFGYGSPTFTENHFFIQGEIDTIGYLFKFDLDGNLIWKKEYGIEWVKNYRGSRSAPTIVDSLVYVNSGFGDIICFNQETGEKKWDVSMINDLHGTLPLFGHSENLITEDDKIFLLPGGKDTNIVALNRFTGELIWKNKGVGERPGYNPPQIIKLAKRNVLVHFSAYEMLGLDTKTGELLWVHAQDNVPLEKRKPGMGDTHSNTVIYENGFIYYVAGDGNCGVKLELSEDGSEITEVWRNVDFDSYMGGVLNIGDYLYTCGSKKPTFMSLNKNTGEIACTLKIGSGAAIYADGLIYYYNRKGNVMLIDPNPADMNVISKFKITKGQNEHFSHPVIHNGVLYIRHAEHFAAYKIK